MHYSTYQAWGEEKWNFLKLLHKDWGQILAN